MLLAMLLYSHQDMNRLDRNAGAIPEVVIDNESGLIFDDGSADSLASKIEQLINDDKLYHTLSIGALKRVRELSSYNSAEQSIQLYNSLCK